MWPLTETIPYLSHAWSWNFEQHLLWLSTTEGTNIVKLLAINQTHQFQLFLTDFWKIAQLLCKIKKTISLRFVTLSFLKKVPLHCFNMFITFLISSSLHIKKAHIFSLKLTPSIWTLVNKDNGNFLGPESPTHILSISLYRLRLSVHRLLSLSLSQN